MIRRRALTLGFGVIAYLLTPTSRGEEPGARPRLVGRTETIYQLRWKVPATSLWPPAVLSDRVILKTGDTVAAHELASGRPLWKRTLSDLRYGEGVLAGAEKYVYLLGRNRLYLLDSRTGEVARTRPVSEPIGVFFEGGSLYLTSAAGLERLDEGAERVEQSAAGFSGEIRATDGTYVALYREQRSTEKAEKKLSPKRLSLVDLKRGKLAYEFKLFPQGWHRVVRMGGGIIAFIDYTQHPAAEGTGRKLFYTEADYTRGAKTKDLSLSSRYTVSSRDTFWIAGSSTGPLFLANHGRPGEHSALMALDRGDGHELWTRSGEVASTGLLLHQGLLWTAATGKDGTAHLVAYRPESGDVVASYAIDSPSTGAPIAVGPAVLLQSRTSVYCFGPRPAEAVAPAARPTPAAASPLTGWHLFRDRVLRYRIRLPPTWSLDRATMKKLGGLRFVIPFVRTELHQGRSLRLGSVHLLSWEAAGRDAEGLWRSVYAQRQRLSPGVRVLEARRVPDAGGTGVEAVIADYAFRGPTGSPVQLRSLCLVSHGIAFELRGWAAAERAEEIWGEVSGIFSGFEPGRI